MKVYLKNIEGFNPYHFETHGRIYEVAVIDYESEEVSVRTPSMLEFPFKDVKFLKQACKDIHEDDIIECEGKKYEVFWDERILTWRVSTFQEDATNTYYCFNLSSIMKKPYKIIGNKNEYQPGDKIS